jgi:2-phosphoglycerate kinase
MMRASRELDISPQRLRHIRWLGGGSGAGKSTVAGLLAGKYGLHLYSTDAMQSAHTARSNAASHPLLHAFIAMTMDERWVKRTPEEMFRTFHGFHGEGFELLLEDLLALPTDLPILVEGYKLLPRLVAPLLSRPDQAVWLLPTPEFRRAALASRESTWSIAGRTSDPETALANFLARDALYTEEIFRQAAALQLTTIQVNGSASVDELVRRVAQCLGLPFARSAHMPT